MLHPYAWRAAADYRRLWHPEPSQIHHPNRRCRTAGGCFSSRRQDGVKSHQNLSVDPERASLNRQNAAFGCLSASSGQWQAVIQSRRPLDAADQYERAWMLSSSCVITYHISTRISREWHRETGQLASWVTAVAQHVRLCWQRGRFVCSVSRPTLVECWRTLRCQNWSHAVLVWLCVS